MSESEHREQQSELCNGGNGDDDDDEEDKEEQGDGGNEDGGGSQLEERRREVNGEGVFRKAIMRSLRRTKKRRNRKEMERDDGENIELPSCTSSSSMAAAAARRGRRSECGGGCYICFMRPRTKESPDTPTSDPNSESFSSEMLRTLMERNNFYSKECNPHI
ncbi:unnamed protein product [Rhodiola kirilowii]